MDAASPVTGQAIEQRRGVGSTHSTWLICAADWLPSIRSCSPQRCCLPAKFGLLLHPDPRILKDGVDPRTGPLVHAVYCGEGAAHPVHHDQGPDGAGLLKAAEEGLSLGP
ncbi:hypothetical protein [Streptomyces sp. YIM 121038]|uniref:hypothetical protein n=1 Tax=Streptomyces sp. YIM 121038 TaxID=2136401 RepID=UPI0011108F62|nr:hypothetical protein [Streptomyces sp. YIM 121038]